MIEIHEILSTQIPNHETTKKRCNIKKQHSKQAKTEEVEINYKMFANPVFINPDRIIILIYINPQLNQLFHYFFWFFQDNMGTDQGKASVSLCGYGH